MLPEEIWSLVAQSTGFSWAHQEMSLGCSDDMDSVWHSWYLLSGRDILWHWSLSSLACLPSRAGNRLALFLESIS